ncbi:hypothetical protein HanIR_Chr02g0056481 [Helianthus annuus]|nr:hypothetical protein HanIR_Chr02g0056481 [Helianthus annuus]
MLTKSQLDVDQKSSRCSPKVKRILVWKLWTPVQAKGDMFLNIIKIVCVSICLK